MEVKTATFLTQTRYAILKKLKTLYNHSCILDATFGNFKDYKESILIKK